MAPLDQPIHRYPWTVSQLFMTPLGQLCIYLFVAISFVPCIPVSVIGYNHARDPSSVGMAVHREHLEGQGIRMTRHLVDNQLPVIPVLAMNSNIAIKSSIKQKNSTLGANLTSLPNLSGRKSSSRHTLVFMGGGGGGGDLIPLEAAPPSPLMNFLNAILLWFPAWLKNSQHQSNAVEHDHYHHCNSRDISGYHKYPGRPGVTPRILGCHWITPSTLTSMVRLTDCTALMAAIGQGVY